MPSGWDDLPQEMQMRVLACLRPPTWLQHREVSKAWKDMIESNEFTQLCDEMWLERPWFLMFQRCKVEAVFMYDPRAKEWYRLPLSFLPVRGAGRAAAGGLLCVEESDDDLFKALYVCDPLARTWTKLPPMADPKTGHKRSVTLMMVDEFINNYKVFVGCNDRIEVYDSLSSSWKSLGRSPMVWFPSTSSVLSQNCLFAMSPSAGNDIVPDFYQLLKFDPDEGSWKPLNVQMPLGLTSPHLTEQGGRIMMVGGVWRNRMVKRIQIWELDQSQPSSPCWDFVSRVPDELWKQSYCGGFNTASAWSGEWICIASRDKLLSFNLRTKSWALSPPNSGPSSGGTNWSIKHGLWNLVNSFKPNFCLERLCLPAKTP